MGNINRAPGGKGSLASTGNYYETHNTEETDNTGTGTKGMVSTMMKTASTKFTDLYGTVEKPVGDLINKVGDRLPAGMKDYTPFMAALIPVISMSLLLFGLFSIFRSDSMSLATNRQKGGKAHAKRR